MLSAVENREMYSSAFMALFVMLLGVCFVRGSAVSCERLGWVFPDERPVETGARGLFLVLAACMALGVFGLPSLYLGGTVVWAVAIWGAVDWAWRRPRVAWSAVLISVAMVGWWANTLAVLPSLPTHHDGIAHTAFFMRTWESANPFLHKTPLNFAEYFGRDLFNYYPNGTHALVAMFGAPFLWAKLVTVASLLKATLIAACASVTTLAWWISRRAFPGIPAWVSLLVALLTATFFQFPVWGIDSGGFSRVVAQVLYLPVLSYLVLTPEWVNSPRRLLVVLGVLPVVLFHVHPSLLGLHMFALAACMFGRFLPRSVGASRLTGKAFAQWVAFGLFGVALVGLLVWSSSSVDVIAKADAAPRQIPFSAEALNWRLMSYVRGVGTQYFGAYFVVALRTVAGVAGFVALLAWPELRRAGSGSRAIFPLVSQLLSLVTLTFAFTSSPLLLNAGGIFYNEAGRVAEVAFLAQVLCWAAGLLLFRTAALAAAERLSASARKPVAIFIASLLVVWAGLDTGPFSKANRKHLWQFFQVYASPHFRDSEDLAEWVRSHTEPNAVLIYPPGSVESLEARTGRQGLFLYAECPYGQNTENCRRRSELFSALEKEVAKIRAGGDTSADCMQDLVVFKERPAYFILPKNSVTSGASFPRPLCKAAVLMAEANGYVIGRYR